MTFALVGFGAGLAFMLVVAWEARRRRRDRARARRIWMAELPELRVSTVLDDVRAEMWRQDRKYDPFAASVAGVLLGLAVLRNELLEAEEAWRDERPVPRWDHTREELMQVAAVAVRILRELPPPPETSRVA